MRFRGRSFPLLTAVLGLAGLLACASSGGDRSLASTSSAPPAPSPAPTPTTAGRALAPDDGGGLGTGFWRTDGSRIVDAAGRSVRVAGVNLFGFETSNLSPLGLWAANYREMLDQIHAEGYNVLRIPWTNQMLDVGVSPSGIDYHRNPDLVGLSPVEVLDRVVVAAGELGLKVLLDRHRPDASGQSALWYTAAYPEQRWLDDWVLLAQRYRGNPTVIGADLHNEPRDPACWGCDAEPWDWRLAAERAGNAILAVNPEWLIFVQGVTTHEGRGTWWGGNLAGAASHPVRLAVPHRLVYSPHEYPTSVHRQDHAADPDYPRNMPAIWDELWGEVHKRGEAPVVLGEFGTRLATEEDRAWLEQLIAYLNGPDGADFGWLYWAWQPASADTGGLVGEDWRTLLVDKDSLLDPIKAPLALTGWTWTPPPPPPGRPPSPAGPEPPTEPPPAPGPVSPPSTPEPSPGTTEPPPPTTTTAPTTTTVPRSGRLQLRYQNLDGDPLNNQAKPTVDVLNDTVETVALDDLTVRYHLNHPPGVGTLQVFCDFAHLGCDRLALGAVATGPTSGYLEMRLRGGALAPGESTGEIQARFASGDWTAMDEGDDPSYVPPAGRWAANDAISVHLGDRLVAGRTP